MSSFSIARIRTLWDTSTSAVNPSTLCSWGGGSGPRAVQGLLASAGTPLEGVLSLDSAMKWVPQDSWLSDYSDRGCSQYGSLPLHTRSSGFPKG